MSRDLASRTGSALIWKGTQLVGVKAIFLVRIVVLARLLSPDDFGVFAVSLVAVDFLLRVTNPGLLPALVQTEPLRKDQLEAAWSLGVVRALGVAGLLVAAAPLVAGLFQEPRAADLLRVLAFQPLLEATASIRVVELVRELRFKSLAFLRLPEAVVNTVVSIVLAPSIGVWALVAGPISGVVAYVALSYLLVPRRPRIRFPRQALAGLLRYGRWIFLTGVVTLAAQFTLKLVISRELGAAALGLYFLAAKLAFLPWEVGEVMTTVAFPVHARLQADPGKTRRAFQAMLRGMAAVVLPACLILIVLAPALVEHVLGEKWSGTVSLIRLLALAPLIDVVGEAVVPLFKGIGRPDRVAVLEIVQCALLVALAWILIPRLGVAGAALAWLPALGASQILAVAFLRRTLARPFADLAPSLLGLTAVSLAAAAVTAGAVGLVGGIGGLLLALASATVVLVGLTWLLDERLRLGLREDLARVFPRAGALLPGRSAEGLGK